MGIIEGICVIHEGFPGHFNQSIGVAEQLTSKTGAKIIDLKVPYFDRFQRLFKIRKRPDHLEKFSQKELLEWLGKAEATSCLEEIDKWIYNEGIKSENILCISAGSRLSPYTYVLGKLFGFKTATIMLDKYMVSELFDFVIMPEHKVHLIGTAKELDEKKDRVFSLHGAANRITEQRVKLAAESFLQGDPSDKKKWVILIGGTSANFKFESDYGKPILEKIWNEAQAEGAEIYLTTSRRTNFETEQMIREEFASRENTKLLWFASEKEGNPTPGLLGLADLVFCTEDSVSMIWETITAGKNVILIPCEPTETFFRIIFRKIRKMIGLLKNKPIIKAEMMRKKYDRLIEKKWGCYLDSPRETLVTPYFNETKLIAEWILANWQSKES